MTDYAYDDPTILGATPALNGHGKTPSPAVSSPLDQLRADVLADLDETVTLPVPARPGWGIVYSTQMPYEQWEMWRRDAIRGGKLDELRWATSALVAQCRDIVKDGQPVGVGGPCTFNTPDLQAVLAADGGPRHAVQLLYGRDGHVIQAFGTLCIEAGYGADAITPTRRG